MMKLNNFQKVSLGISLASFAMTAVNVGIVKISEKKKPTDVRQIGDYTITIVTDPEKIHNESANIACVDIDYVDTEKKTMTVFVDGYFYCFTRSQQNVFLAHEVGHIIKPDGMPTGIAAFTYKLDRMVGNVPDCELIADSYAVELYGKTAVKMALLSILRFCQPAGYHEIISRIRAI